MRCDKCDTLMVEHKDNFVCLKCEKRVQKDYSELLRRIEALEERVARIPCDHVGFQIDEEYELDEDDYEVSVNICRNCGQRV